MSPSKFRYLLAGTLFTAFFLISARTDVERKLSSSNFPSVSVTYDTDEMLERYPVYLDFVLSIGKATEPEYSKKLANTYAALRKKDPRGAARFLKGLRFELVHKLELVGMNPAHVTTATPAVRMWVTRYIKAWYREADEYLFKAIAVRPVTQ